MAENSYEAVFVWLGTPPGAAFVWGLFLHAFGALLALVFVGWIINLPSMAGSYGLTPAARNLSAYYRDFGVRALIYWPSVMWAMLLCRGRPRLQDAMLRLVPTAGFLAGVAVAVGGSHSPVALLVAWVALLSIDNGAATLMFPWDSLLLEASFLALWLPGTNTLLQATPLAGWLPGADAAGSPPPRSTWVQALSLAHAPGAPAAAPLPSPLLAFLFRYLIARVLLGFGKMKFQGSTRRDLTYIKNFLINQPVTAPLAFLANRSLPDWFWVLALGIMWVVEIPLPLLAFVPGWPRVAFGAGTIALMGGIASSGNYGYFNVLTCIMCIPLFAHAGTVFDTSIVAHVTGGSAADAALAAVAAAVLLPGSVLYFIFNSWVNNAWAHWPAWARVRPAWLFGGVVRWLRALAPLRLVQAYGVFPPNSAPAQRWVVQFEASSDRGASWLPLPTPYLSFAMGHIAPYHPRLDQSLFYESGGMNGSNYMGTLSHHSPYGWSFTSAWVRCQLLLARALALGLQPRDPGEAEGAAPAANDDDAAAAAAAAGSWPGAEQYLLRRFARLPSTAQLPPAHFRPSAPSESPSSSPLPPPLRYTVHPEGTPPAPHWRFLGPTVSVRAALLSAVPKPLGRYLAMCRDILSGALTARAQVAAALAAADRAAGRIREQGYETDAAAAGGEDDAGATTAGVITAGAAAVTPGARAPALALPPAETLTLLQRLQLAAWDVVSCGTHSAPLAVFDAYLEPASGPAASSSSSAPRVHYIPHPYAAVLERTQTPASPADFWWESVVWRQASSLGRWGGVVAVSDALARFNSSPADSKGAVQPQQPPASALPPAVALPALASASDYELFWRFVAVVRSAAVAGTRARAAGAEEAAAGAADQQPARVTRSSATSTLRQRRRGGGGGAAVSASGASEAEVARAALAASPADAPIAVLDVTAATQVLEVPPPATLLLAAAAVAAGADGPLDPAAANAVFAWAALPAVAAAVFGAFAPAERARIRAALNALALPLREACEALGLRLLDPDPVVLQPEPAAAVGASSKGLHRAGVLDALCTGHLTALVEGPPPAPAVPPRTALCGGDEVPVTVFRENDDAVYLVAAAARAAEGSGDGPAAVPTTGTVVELLAGGGAAAALAAALRQAAAAASGCLRSPVRFGMVAHWLLLVGGRAVYERTVRQLRVAAEAAAAAGAPAGQQQHLRAVFRALNGGEAEAGLAAAAPSPPPLPLSFSLLAAGTESGTFLLAAADHDAFATFAARAQYVALAARPKRLPEVSNPPAPLPAFLPGFVELLPRLALHAPRLVAWDHCSGAAPRPLAPLVYPVWGYAPASGEWALLKRLQAPAAPGEGEEEEE